MTGAAAKLRRISLRSRVVSAVAALASLLAFPTASGANPIQHETVTELWTNFLEVCGKVAFEPLNVVAEPVVRDGYRNSLVIRNEAGTNTYVSQYASDDGTGIAIEYTVLRAEKTAVVDCTVSYNVAANLDVGSVSALIRQMIEAEGKMRLVGGPNSLETNTGMFSTGSLENVSNTFVIEGAVPGTDFAVMTTVEAVTFFFAIVGSVELEP